MLWASTGTWGHVLYGAWFVAALAAVRPYSLITKKTTGGWQSVKYTMDSWQWRHHCRKSQAYPLHDNRSPSIVEILHSGTCFWRGSRLATLRSCVNERSNSREKPSFCWKMARKVPLTQKVLRDHFCFFFVFLLCILKSPESWGRQSFTLSPAACSVGGMRQNNANNFSLSLNARPGETNVI